MKWKNGFLYIAILIFSSAIVLWLAWSNENLKRELAQRDTSYRQVLKESKEIERQAELLLSFREQFGSEPKLIKLADQRVDVLYFTNDGNLHAAFTFDQGNRWLEVPQELIQLPGQSGNQTEAKP